MEIKVNSIVSYYGDFDWVSKVDHNSGWPYTLQIKNSTKDSSSLTHSFYTKAGNINLEIVGVSIVAKFVDDTPSWVKASTLVEAIDSKHKQSHKNLENVVNKIIANIGSDFDQHKKDLAYKQEMQQKGSNLNPTTVIINEAEEVKIDVDTSDSIREQFQTVISQTSKVTEKINKEHSLGDNKFLVEAFMEAKKKIEELQSSKPTKTSLAAKYLKKVPGMSSIGRAVKDIKTEHKSVQANIDELFGVIADKHEKLIVVAEGLQEAKANMMAQATTSADILIRLEDSLSHYDNPADIPIRDTLLQSQIQSHITKLEDRVMKVEGAFMATQATILKLGQDLPSKKADLTDESALSSLLSNVDDFQKMWTETSDLVSTLTDETADRVHTVVENLMQIQIDDTHTTKYLADVSTRGTKFANMLKNKTAEYEVKVRQDAKFISTIAAGNTLEDARKASKMIKG